MVIGSASWTGMISIWPMRETLAITSAMPATSLGFDVRDPLTPGFSTRAASPALFNSRARWKSRCRYRSCPRESRHSDRGWLHMRLSASATVHNRL